MIISDFPIIKGSVASGSLVFVYDGEHSIIDDGSESGEKKVALITSGILTLLSPVNNATIMAQGGGGAGGSGYESGSGSDGEDGGYGNYTGNLAAGQYTITIGAGGSAPTNADGNSGGETSFSDVVIASGGAGGAYKGGMNIEHSGLYDTYGHGGQGGASSQYTGEISYSYRFYGNTFYYNKYSSPSTASTPIQTSGNTLLWGNTPTQYPDEAGTSEKFYRTALNYYVKVSDGTIEQETNDRREWYGNAGNPGIIILSGKA